MGSLTFLLPVSNKRESLTRWAWGMAWVALGVCLLWYALACVVEARTNTIGGYVPVYAGQGPEREWVDDRWVGPVQYGRHKYADASAAILFAGCCVYVAYNLLTDADDHKSYLMSVRRDNKAYRHRAILGCTPIACEGPYMDAGWKQIPRKAARGLAKQPPGRYWYTVGGPDKFCRQRDYLNLIRNQKRQWDVEAAVEAKGMAWAGTEVRVRT